jgi:hypothetical protein
MEDWAYMTESYDADNTLPQPSGDSCEHRRGEELRRWQVQEHTKLLHDLIVIVSEIACSLLMAHPDWEIQEQVHLDHTSLEVRSRTEAETVVVECRWAEDLEWQDYGAVEVSIARFTDFRVVSAPDVFEYTPEWPSAAIDALVSEIEQEVNAQALIAGQGLESPMQRSE